MTFLNRLLRIRCAISGPLWKIFRSGTNTSVEWTDHAPNPRFAIYDPKNDSDPANPATLSDDFVLDKETGLVWARDANLLGSNNWLDSNTLCRELQLGNRAGWRLPGVEELTSLVDPSQQNLALPTGHPFLNVQYGSGVPAYWSSTNCENPTGAVWFVNFWRGAGPHLTGLGNKSIPGYAWPVRGGTGGNNWNW
jgi:hypothetical protein